MLSRYVYFYGLFLNEKVMLTRSTVFLVCIVWLICMDQQLLAQQRASSVDEFVITITFANPPVSPTVFKAPLKYNKDFALILQMDDGNASVHDQVMPYFKGQGGNPGLYFSDGAQGTVPFKMDAVHYSFDDEGEDVHNYKPGFLNWSNMETLWAAEFGINSQGLNKTPKVDPFVEVLRNISYTRRNTSQTIIQGGADMNIHVVPDDAPDQLPVAKQHSLAVYHNGPTAANNPVRVENLPAIQGVELKRAPITTNLISQIQQIAEQSGSDNHLIATFYNNGFSSPNISFDLFKAQMNQVAAVYGKDGTDRIWSSSATEIFEYLRIKELVSMQSSLEGNTLTITFTGNNIPDDFRYYALSVVVEGESLITNMVVQQPDAISTYTYGGTKALINMRWNGKTPVDNLARAQEYVLQAEQSPTQANGISAMDYVKMLPDSDQKEELRQRLCALSDIVYDPGFCPLFDFLGGDRNVCLGDMLVLEGPPDLTYLWSTGETNQSIELFPEEELEVWLRVTDQANNVYYDTIMITVSEPPLILVNPSVITIDPGEEVILAASGGVSYLWSTGSEDSVILVTPPTSALYTVTGTDQNGCSSVAAAQVIVLFTNIIDFDYNTVCFGDTTVLISNIVSNDSIMLREWDLNGDGIFGDAEGDTLKILFDIPGEKLIGFRVKTLSGAIPLKYHAVPVADQPEIIIDFDGICLGQVTTFENNSTVIVGTITTWEWDFGDGGVSSEKNPERIFTDAGSYDVILTAESNYGCRTEEIITIEISNPIEADIRLNDGTIVSDNSVFDIFQGESLLLVATGSYDSVIWSTGVKGAQFTVNTAGNYSVTVYKGGCSDQLNFRVTVQVPKPGLNNIMNLITPNNDGYNDVWLVRSVARPMQVVVYNRLGNKVFESSDYQDDWDGVYNGNPLPEGTYYYVIVGADKLVYKGPVSILY
jgi:gliding motility-associated-like protein